MALGIWGGIALVVAILAGVLTLSIYGLGLVTTLSIAFVVICVIMMLVILAQKPTGGGLSGAFGGAGGGGSQTAFGAKTGDVMTWATIILFILFIGVAMGLTWTTSPSPVIAPSILPTTTQTDQPGHEGHGHGDLSQSDQSPAGETAAAAPAATPAVTPAAGTGATPGVNPGATPGATPGTATGQAAPEQAP